VKRFEGVYAKELAVGFPIVLVVFVLMGYMVVEGEFAQPVGKVEDNVREVGTLFTSYLFPFEVASVILLVAMIGAILLGRKEE